MIMQLFKHLPAALFTILVFACAPAFAQETEEKEEIHETEIIIITETIDENGNKNVNKNTFKGKFTDAEIDKIVKEESVGELVPGSVQETKIIVDREVHQDGDGHHAEGELHESHEKGYLGVNIENAQGQGVRVTGVSEGSPAESAGIVAGDVIKAVNGETVAGADALIRVVSNQAVGDEVEVTYSHQGEPTTIKVTLGERPKSEMEKAMQDVEGFKWVEKESTPKRKLGVYIESVDHGVKITEVVENSRAQSAGLKAGDVITSYNGNAVSTPEELIEAVQQKSDSEDIVVEFQRDGKKMKNIVSFKKK
jgi:predicted metalloprotease with PDZ domain